MSGGGRAAAADAAPLPPGAWERDHLPPGFAPDCVALDIDGVLIDVSESFREAARETVVIMQAELGSERPWRPAPADIDALKAARGFNDEIDLSIALIAIALGGRADGLDALCSELDAAGGGLAALARVAPELPRIPGRRVLEVFDALYWGEPFPPGPRGAATPAGQALRRPGLVERERPLVEPDLPGRLRAAGIAHVGVISGRTPRELAGALEQLGWARSDLDAVVTGDLARKPDPACVDRVVAATGARRIVFAGDVRDDWELVVRHRAERPTGPGMRGVLVGPAARVATLRALGADATVERADDLVPLMGRWAAGRSDLRRGFRPVRRAGPAPPG